MDSPRETDADTSWRNKWSARRNAVFLPIPGKRDISATAFSSNTESNSCIIFYIQSTSHAPATTAAVVNVIFALQIYAFSFNQAIGSIGICYKTYRRRAFVNLIIYIFAK